MSIETVREYLKKYNRAQDIIELSQSSATVELAAKALGIEGKRIAKTLSFWIRDQAIVVVCAIDCKIDNHAFKETFHIKARMMSPEDVHTYTGHPVGGVCPFAVPETTDIYLDESLKRFSSVYPACGSDNSAIEVTMEDLERMVPYVSWVDVCKGWKEEEDN